MWIFSTKCQKLSPLSDQKVQNYIKGGFILDQISFVTYLKVKNPPHTPNKTQNFDGS